MAVLMAQGVIKGFGAAIGEKAFDVVSHQYKEALESTKKTTTQVENDFNHSKSNI